MQGLSSMPKVSFVRGSFKVAHAFDAGPLVNAGALLNAGSFFDV